MSSSGSRQAPVKCAMSAPFSDVKETALRHSLSSVRGARCSTVGRRIMPVARADSRIAKIMLVGSDHKQILEKRLKAAGCQVLKVNDNKAAIDHARHECLDTTVLVSSGSLINVAETIFNLRDLNGSMEIIILVDRLGRHSSRFLQQLIEHPISGTRILTRRQLQRLLHTSTPSSPPGGPF